MVVLEAGRSLYEQHRDIFRAWGIEPPSWTALSNEQKATWNQHAYGIEAQDREEAK